MTIIAEDNQIFVYLQWEINLLLFTIKKSCTSAIQNMKCSGNVSFLYNTYFTQQRARLLLYFSVILTLHEYLHFYYKQSLDKNF